MAGSAILVVSLVAAVVTGLQLRKAAREQAEANVSFKSAAAEITLDKTPLDGLIKALKSGKQLQDLEKSAPVALETQKQVENTLRKAIALVRERNRLEGHESAVITVSISPNGQLVASGDESNIVKLWDVKGNLITTFKGHSEKILSVSFSPDSKTLASSGHDGTIKLWNVENGTRKKTILAHNNTWARSVNFSPLEGIEPRTLIGHSGKVSTVNFSPDGKTLASADTDDTIKLWNVQDRRLQKTLKGHKGDVLRVSFSPNGKFLASASSDGTVKLLRSRVSESLAEIETMKKTFIYSFVVFFRYCFLAVDCFPRIRTAIIQTIQAAEAARLPRILRLLKAKT
jgi:WD40 repeat protein